VIYVQVEEVEEQLIIILLYDTTKRRKRGSTLKHVASDGQGRRIFELGQRAHVVGHVSILTSKGRKSSKKPR